jgi:hypothetical protein
VSILNPDLVLRRSARVCVEVVEQNVRVEHSGKVVEVGRHALAVLDAFSQPQTVREAIGKFEAHASSPQEWMDYVNTMWSLFQAGALEDDANASSVAAVSYSYAAPSIHIKMLNDRVRTSNYIQAIGNVVRSGDVVVEIGTGTGILSIAAAQAGANRVYAIESGAMGKLAEENFRVNGVEDVVQLVSGWSTHVQLPEHADVMVSEMVGDDPLAEGILEVTLDARKRFLRKDARVLPSRLTLKAVPVTVPEGSLSDFAFTTRLVRQWQKDYGIDLNGLTEYGHHSDELLAVYPKIRDSRQFVPLGDAVTLADIDLANFECTKLSACTQAGVESGTMNGVLSYFELELQPGRVISNAPWAADDDCHWRNVLWLCAKPLQVKSGDKVGMQFAYSHLHSALRLTPPS